MTCARYEADLALYVERDLPAAAAETVEAHLGSCAPCRSFLAELRASQSRVKGLALAELDADALASVRVRVVVAAASPRPHLRGGERLPALAAAAAIVLALGAIGWVVWLVGSTQPRRSVAAVPPRLAPAVVARESTLASPPPVSPHMERAHAGRGRTDRPIPVPALSPDDADQLARAVVAIAGIRSLDDLRPDVEPPPAAAPLMRLATADPDVVIYWQLEPSGGE
jgi:anti-sigma factor RsiW